MHHISHTSTHVTHDIDTVRVLAHAQIHRYMLTDRPLQSVVSNAARCGAGERNAISPLVMTRKW